MSGPPIHIKTEDGELRICFSRLMKIIMGVATTLTGLLLAGVFAFAWSSNDKLGNINERLSNLNQRFDRMDRRVDRVEDRINHD